MNLRHRGSRKCSSHLASASVLAKSVKSRARFKTIAFAVKERGGRIETRVVPDASTASIRPIVEEVVEKVSIASTDEWNGYNLLKNASYEHGGVDHSREEWAWYDRRYGAMHHTNSTESFWNLFKNSIKSTHNHVSPEA